MRILVALLIALSVNTAIAGPAIIWGPSGSAKVLNQQGGLLLNSAAATCATALAGSLRWQSSTLSVCDGSSWTALSTGDSPGALSDGSVSAPSLAFADDANTGLYSSAADTLDATAGGQRGMSITKSTGAFANVAFGGGAASVSDIYAMITKRDQAQLTAFAIENLEGSAAAGSQIKFIADIGAISSADITLYPTAATLAAYDNRFAIRSADASSGISLLAAGAANSDIRIYSDGGAAGDEIVRFNGDYSVQVMQQITIPASPSSGSIKIFGASDKLLTVDDNGNGEDLATNNPNEITNCSIAGSVGSSALTVAIKNSAGSDPSAISPCIISFRSATAATGTYTRVRFTAAASVVVSNGSSLGCPAAAAACTVYVYAIDNAGTAVLGVVTGKLFDEGTVQSSTAEGGAGAADTIGTMYSTAGQTSKAVRMLARITVTPGASFAWDAGPTEISNVPFVHDLPRIWTSYTPTFTGFGTASNVDFRWRRDGPDMIIRGYVTSTTPTGVEGRVSLPTGYTASAAIATLEIAGQAAVTDVGAGTWYVLREPSVTYVTFGVANGGNAGLVKIFGSSFIGSGSSFSFEARIPILGWGN